MPVYKFIWDQEFGWDDWREQEWSVRAKTVRDAWFKFYDFYGVWDAYIEWLEEQSEEEIEIDEKELWKTVKLEELEKHANYLVSSEILRVDITGAKIHKI